MNANVGFWEKTEGEQQKGKTKRTWRGVFVLAPFWWCSACSSAGEHGTSSHTSYCLGSVKKKKGITHYWGRFFLLPWDEPDRPGCLPCGSPRDVPIRLGRPLWTPGCPGPPTWCIPDNGRHTAADTRSPTAACTLEMIRTRQHMLPKLLVLSSIIWI